MRGGRSRGSSRTDARGRSSATARARPPAAPGRCGRSAGRPSAGSDRRRARTSQASERHVLAATARARTNDCLADLRRAVAVLERRAVRCEVAAVGDRTQEVMHLVHEGIAPADDVSGRPPEVHEGMVRLSDKDGPEAARPFFAVEEDLQLVHPLHVEVEGAAGAVDLPLKRVAASQRKAGRLDRPDRAALELDSLPDRVLDLATLHEGLHDPGDGHELTDEVAREVDHVRTEIPERAGSCLVRIEAPRVERRVVAPVLEVTAAEVANLSERALVDQFAREAHGGDEAVVESAEMPD